MIGIHTQKGCGCVGVGGSNSINNTLAPRHPHPFPDVRHMSHAACRTPNVARRMSHVISCMSHVACRMLHVACRMWHVAYMSHVARRMCNV